MRETEESNDSDKGFANQNRGLVLNGIFKDYFEPKSMKSYQNYLSYVW